jgi:uncharacterized protein (TIGR02757 family)
MSKTRELLDKFYHEYDFSGRLSHDPIEFPHRYKNKLDIESTGLIASCFAYGRVDLFKPVIGKILAVMGKSPHEFLIEFNPKKHTKFFNGISYRFNKENDIQCFIHVISKILKKYGSIESAFMKYYKKDDPDIGHALKGFISYMLSTVFPSIHKNKKQASDGFKQFFPSPVGGSACKRANLFLRWMIRNKDIDFGIWKGVPMNKLIIPLDTHIAKISRCIGLSKRKSADWQMAAEITNALKRFDPVDPLKYDFAMCHYGISKMCKGLSSKSKTTCKNCVLKS